MSGQERSIRAEAVVLRHSDWGEADRLLSIYTREMGKLRAIAKGVRKMHSRKAGHLQPFTRVSLQLARGRDLFIITQAETVHPYLHLRQDLLLLGYAAYVVELLDRFTYENDDNNSIYRLLWKTLARLDAESDPLLAVHYYEIHLLDLLGYRPELFKCVNCENEIKPEDQFFSATRGGVLCSSCGKTDRHTRRISMTALKYLRHFQRSSYAEASRARLSPTINQEIDSLMQHYLTFILERNLNSPAFLQHLKGK
jgi:DNA repair protein RecO (recombination protein O)